MIDIDQSKMITLESNAGNCRYQASQVDHRRQIEMKSYVGSHLPEGKARSRIVPREIYLFVKRDHQVDKMKPRCPSLRHREKKFSQYRCLRSPRIVKRGFVTSLEFRVSYLRKSNWKVMVAIQGCEKGSVISNCLGS
ncbi:hypothetical protein F3Y22_tig00112107pilonHSYRG00023 [Hibiscus syriacus]|uniref:Uncharacterized protein n=1 Tax=Hibiscus syriacus TaxID=106335 RepID=A0A6A2XLS5_HIBSY|nr:hypothetical protein F3Y22_tig00112107pilonHSYRG00023 [Hibiscus syriacus]